MVIRSVIMIKVHKLTVILTLLCLFCSCDRNDADIEIFRRADWQGEYEKYLNDNINDEYAAPAYGFDFLYTDIDGDNEYELIAGLKNMNGHSVDTLLIYDIVDGNPCYIGKMYGETEVSEADSETAPDFFEGDALKMYRSDGKTKLLSYSSERHGGQYYYLISAAEVCGEEVTSDIIGYKCGTEDKCFYSLEVFGEKISDSDFEALISDEVSGYEKYVSSLPEIHETFAFDGSQS